MNQILAAAAIFDVYHSEKPKELSENLRIYLLENNKSVETLRPALLSINEDVGEIIIKLLDLHKQDIANDLQQYYKQLNQECDYWLEPTQPIDISSLD